MCNYKARFFLGFGNGTNKWIVFFNGGAWCYDEEACYERSQGVYGSTSFKTKGDHSRLNTFCAAGLYSTNPRVSPDFYNWNAVFVIYCDGSSFTGMREEPVYFEDKPVYFRGKAVLEAIIQDLLSRGIRNASDVLLSGSSAGGLAVLIHADLIKSKLNPKTKVRALADGGYFVDLRTQHGERKIRKRYTRMLSVHNSTAGLHQACIERLDTDEHWKCLFPQYFFDVIETPVFVLQSAYDLWQIMNSLGVICNIPSYKDMLMFRSLRLLRNVVYDNTTKAPFWTSIQHHKTSRTYDVKNHESRGISHASRGAIHKSRLTGHASRGTNYARKLNGNFVPNKTKKAPFWTSGISHKTSHAYRVKGHESRGISHASRKAIHKSRRTSHASRRTSHASRRISHYYARKLNTFRHKKNYQRTNILIGIRNKFKAKHIPRASRVTKLVSRVNPRADKRWENSRGHMRSPNGHPQTFVRTFENTHVLSNTHQESKKPHSVKNASPAHFRQKREPRKLHKSRSKLREIVKKQKQPYQWNWQLLYSDRPSCTKDETETILTMRNLTIHALKPVFNKPGTRLFLLSCFGHVQASHTRIWMKSKVDGKTPREAIADWYFGRPRNHTYIGPEFDFGLCTV